MATTADKFTEHHLLLLSREQLGSLCILDTCVPKFRNADIYTSELMDLRAIVRTSDLRGKTQLYRHGPIWNAIRFAAMLQPSGSVADQIADDALEAIVAVLR